MWSKHQTELLQQCQGRDVQLAGDARCCSPGHTAKYGRYTVMDQETGYVLDVQLVQCNEVENASAMELEGLKRALSSSHDKDINVSDITTDRHGQVKKFLREQRGDIRHWFDGWHLAKNIKKKLSSLGKKKGCESVSLWTQSIANHLYFCAATSDGDGDTVQDKWMSIINHVCNNHEGHGSKFPRCLHGPIIQNWIQPGSKTHKELNLVVTSTRLLHAIRKISPTAQTSMLESQHKIVCQFAPKFVSFTYPAMKQRLHLAALHHNFNIDRRQAVTETGSLRWQLSYPKYKQGGHVIKPVMEDCSYDYIDQLLQEVIQLREQHTSQQSAESSAMEVLLSLPPVCSTANRIDKEKVVLEHQSRFNIPSQKN